LSLSNEAKRAERINFRECATSFSRTGLKNERFLDKNMNNKRKSSVPDRRKSGRLALKAKNPSLSSSSSIPTNREKLVSHSRKLIRSARLASLESDNYEERDDVDDFNDQNYVEGGDEDDDDVEFEEKKGRKRKKESKVIEEVKCKTLEQILEDEGYEDSGPEVMNYFKAQGAPSKKPPRKFCSVCGQESPYTCTRCSMRFCSIRCEVHHRDTRCLKFTT